MCETNGWSSDGGVTKLIFWKKQKKPKVFFSVVLCGLIILLLYMQPSAGPGTGAAVHDPFGVAKVWNRVSFFFAISLCFVFFFFLILSCNSQGFVGLEIPAEQLTIEEELSKDKDGEDIGRFGKVFKGRCFGLEVRRLQYTWRPWALLFSITPYR